MRACKRVVIQYYIILPNIFHQNGYYPIDTIHTTQYVSILHMVIFFFHAALDARSRLKLYWIDLIDSACCQKILLSLVNCTIHLNNKMMDSATEYLKKPMQALFLRCFRC